MTRKSSTLSRPKLSNNIGPWIRSFRELPSLTRVERKKAEKIIVERMKRINFSFYSGAELYSSSSGTLSQCMAILICRDAIDRPQKSGKPNERHEEILKEMVIDFISLPGRDRDYPGGYYLSQEALDHVELVFGENFQHSEEEFEYLKSKMLGRIY